MDGIIFLFVVLIVVAIPIAIAWGLLKAYDERQRQKHLAYRAIVLVKVHQAVKAHIQALATKSEQLKIVDEYGTTDASKWTKEVSNFCQKIVGPALGWGWFPPDNERTVGDFPVLQRDVAAIIEAEIRIYKSEHPARSQSVANLSPIEFEHYCADVLHNNGWDARTTKRSGDQGVDILATKNNRRGVFQCELYSYPVGNKAVQECYSAKDFSRADFAVVVTNSRFTPSAKQLAGSLGVLLMHHSELEHLDERIAKNNPRG